MFDIKENLKKLPDAPGVYIHKDQLGQVIYVGKAISLKNRVRQYFQSSKNMDAKVRAMVGNIAEFEYIRCNSEMEAFILENNLIKKYRPKYNVLLRDDKTYPYIKVTTKEDWPRVIKTRRIENDGNKYFGPYTDVLAVNRTIELLNGVYSLKKCQARTFPKNAKPCLNYHIGQCDGICIGKGNHEEYLEKIDSVLEYLKGQNKELLSYLKMKMNSASEELDYEEAARYRDYIIGAKALNEKQKVMLNSDVDIDIVLSATEEVIALFFVRDGKLIGRETHNLQVESDYQKEDGVPAFIKQYYGEQANGPKEILVGKAFDEMELIEKYLSNLWSHKVSLKVPQKGDKKALLDLAKKNAVELIKTIEDREKLKEKRLFSLGEQIHEVLSDMKELPIYDGKEYRVEAYDISNTNGLDTVGGMVVFKGNKPERKSYRRFKVRTTEGQDDYNSMQEVLFRRLNRAIKNDPGFSTLPDILLMDGGKGHVTAATQVVKALKIDIPVVGMVKDDSHRTRGLIYEKDGEFVEIELKNLPFLFKFIGTIQEEVHRFAISYHRNLRDKKNITSVLDQIEGIGKVKRNALLSHFGSIENIKNASIEDIMTVDGITLKLAESVRKKLVDKKT